MIFIFFLLSRAAWRFFLSYFWLLVYLPSSMVVIGGVVCFVGGRHHGFVHSRKE